MRVWVDRGGDNCCKDGIYDGCLMYRFKCFLGRGGEGASGDGEIVVALGLVIGCWWWW